MVSRRHVVGAMVLAPAWSLAAKSAFAQGFPHKTLTFVVGSSPGGSLDLIGRTVVRYMAKYLPKDPTIVVQNMGAARGLQTANYLFNNAAKDGSTFGMPSRAFLTQPRLDKTGIYYDIQKFGYIGSVCPDNQVFYVRSDVAKTVDDLKKRQINMGMTGTAPELYAMYSLLNDKFGAKIKVIPGYPGAVETNLAMARGEVDGSAISFSGLKATARDWLKNGFIDIVLQIGKTRSSELPNVPLLTEVLPEDKELADFFSYVMEASMPFIMPPGVDATTLNIYRQAFMQTMTDSGFVADALKIGFKPDPMNGPDMESLVQSIVDVPESRMQQIRKFAGLH